MVEATDAPSFIGIARARVDSEEKVRARPATRPTRAGRGLLHARLVLSLYAHARIRSIDTSAALAVPGVVAVLTAEDLPIKVEDMRMFEPLARERGGVRGPAGRDGRRRDRGRRRGRRGEVVTSMPSALPAVDRPRGRHGCRGAARPDRPAVAVGEAGEGRPPSPHAAVGGGAELARRGAVGQRRTRKHSPTGDVDAALAGSAVTRRGHVHDRVGLPGRTSSRTARPRGSSRRRRWSSRAAPRASSTRARSWPRSSACRSQGPGRGHAAGRRVRLQDHGGRAARRRRRARAAPARPPRAHAARGHGDDEPGARHPRSSSDRRRRRTAGSPGSIAPGLRRRRVLRVDRREHRRGPHRRAVSLAGVGHQGVRRRDEPRSGRARTAGPAGRRRRSRSRG